MVQKKNGSKASEKLEAYGLDLEFRPTTYWPPNHPTMGSATNEFERRVGIAIETGDWSKVRIPGVSFALRGGDFLPAFKPGEVEIARLALESATSDVTSIRARPSRRGILYRVVDEYQADYSFRPKSSKQPLTLARLIQFIERLEHDDQVCSPSMLRESQVDLDSEDDIIAVRSFVSVTSEFYKDLEPWYETEAQAWADRHLAELPERLRRAEEAKAAEIRSLQEGVASGDADAMNRLGYRYLRGDGVPRSAERAVTLWEDAVAHGDTRAKLNLAVCLQGGNGTAQDETRALALYEDLASDGYYVGLDRASYCRTVGIGCEPDNLKSLFWHFEKAKKAGPFNSPYSPIVDCLLRGDGTTNLEKEARAWLQSAAASCKENKHILASLDRVSSGEVPDLPPKYGVGYVYFGDEPLVKAEGY